MIHHANAESTPMQLPSKQSRKWNGYYISWDGFLRYSLKCVLWHPSGTAQIPVKQARLGQCTWHCQLYFGQEHIIES